jgi:hypothetical protein
MFLQLGFHHILTLSAYDHLLFITLLTVGYRPRHWKIVLALVTAFTLGHTASLAATAAGLVSMKGAVVEWLIALTILVTGIEGLLEGIEENPAVFTRKYIIKYSMAMVYGLVHGMGFASALKSLLGDQGRWIVSLLAFNTGVEMGQWVVVLCMMIISYLAVDQLRIKSRTWRLAVSLTGVLAALVILVYRFP